jgi:hypothetical protein
MGIRLNWEVEAENTSTQSIGEDPNAKKARRAARYRLLVTVAIVLGVIAALIVIAFSRVNNVNKQIAQALRDTVDAEVAALRIGDWNAFADIQRSATDEWIQSQRSLFDGIQQMLSTNDNAQLTGRILDVTVDEPRGRVAIEEIVDGVPYTRIWFYWRYEEDLDDDKEIDGWRHVPPDYTFWGEARRYDGHAVVVNYHQVDEELANLVGGRFDEWINVACDAGLCDVPEITVEIEPVDVQLLNWSSDIPWTLEMTSPYVERARSDLPFSPEMQIEAASLLAERIVLESSGNIRAIYPSDAYYLQQAVTSWLVGRFVLIDTNSFLISSLANTYGDEAVGRLLGMMQSDSNVNILTDVTGATLDHLSLDWRDFFTWRLALENDLIARQDPDSFLQLYDTRDESIRNAATTRFNDNVGGQSVVTQVLPAHLSILNEPQLIAKVHISQGDATFDMDVLFRLIDNIWRRAS